MNNKWIILFIVFLVSLLAIGSVSAANFTNRDFDGYFSMKVPTGSTFEKESNITNESGFNIVDLAYMNDNLAIFYFDDPAYSENSSACFYQMMFETMNPDLAECYESQEGNLTILEPVAKNDMNFPLVGTSQGNKIIIVMGDDVNLIKQMGTSIKFK